MDPAVHLLVKVEIVWPPPSGKLSQPFSLMMTLDFAGLPLSGKHSQPLSSLMITLDFARLPPSGKQFQPFTSLMMTLDFAGLRPGGKLFLSLILQDYLGFLYPGYAHLTSP